MTRARRTMRVPTAAQLAVGASVLAFPATAVALNTGAITASAATPSGPLQAVASLPAVSAATATYGRPVIVRGRLPRTAAGRRLELEYRAADSRHWRTLDLGRVRRNGQYTLSARLVRSGALQVRPVPAALPAPRASAQPQPTGQAGRAPANRPFFGPSVTPTVAAHTADRSTPVLLQPSAISRVSVAPRLELARTARTALLGRDAQVRGRLMPGIPGRRLMLVALRDHRWERVAVGRTRRGGAFDIRLPAPAGRELVHVVFAGDRLNRRAASAGESITGMQYAEVSWYYDAGDTACGFHATYGIASRTLPCGTKVTLSYGGRTVVATVDDRGPFVYSRLYDLNQNVAGALGMGGVATVLASV